MRKEGGFGIWTLTFLVVASMVGAGVFTTSGFTLASLRDPWLVLGAWLAGGVVALAGAYSYGRLVRLIPESGGEYAFLSRAAHPFLGFVAGWVSLLAGFSGAIAFAATTMESYLPLPEGVPKGTVAVAVVLLGAGLHGYYRSAGAVTQNLSVMVKLGLIVAFIVVAGVDWGGGDWKGQGLPAEADPAPWWLSFAQALVWISLSYSGFNAAVYVAGEAKSPAVVAKALLSGTGIVVAMYLLLNGAFVLAPASEDIAGQPDVAAVAAEAIGGPWLAGAVRGVIALALFTSVLSMMMAGPRVYAKMADDGFLPQALCLRPDRHWPPVMLQAAIAIGMILAATLQDLLEIPRADPVTLGGGLGGLLVHAGEPEKAAGRRTGAPGIVRGRDPALGGPAGRTGSLAGPRHGADGGRRRRDVPGERKGATQAQPRPLNGTGHGAGADTS